MKEDRCGNKEGEVSLIKLTTCRFGLVFGGGVDHDGAGVLPSPCFSNFLARTTFVLESLPEAKNPGQDANFRDFVFNSSNS